MAKASYQQGDIVLIPYSYTDLSSVKRRPVVIISKDSINKDFFIVAKITSVLRSDELSFSLLTEQVKSNISTE
jgi:mRNA interferase MazF